MTFIADIPTISSWNQHPTQVPDGKYKFISVEVNLNAQVQVINRDTYDALAWLGDIGGLLDSLIYISGFLLKPWT